jgi:iron complex transport system substrate-binding protein
MATRTRAAAAALALAVLLAACGGTGPTGSGATKTTKAADDTKVTVVEAAPPTPVLPAVGTNADGTKVEITDVSRIVPLWGNLSEIVFALGLGKNVVARDVTATFAEADDLDIVTQGHDVSAEAVLAHRPSLVLATTDSGPPEALEHIRNAGVPVLVVKDPLSIDDVRSRILLVSTALGVPEEGKKLADKTMAEIADVQKAIPTDQPKPRIAFLYMRGQAGVYLIAGPGSGADSMIEAAGGTDAGTDMGLERAFTPLTSEALVTAAPEVILMTTTGLASVGGLDGLLKIPGIKQTPAGVARRVVTIEDGLLYSFGSRTPEALRELIRDIYAEPGS